MGSHTRYRQRFLKENTKCIFCGGENESTTVEHCPPRSMFKFKKWPEGFDFPSCQECNFGTSNDDILIAMLARFDPINNDGDSDGKQSGIFKKVKRQFPDLIDKMLPSPTEARKINRKLGIDPPAGQTHNQSGAIKIPKEFNQAVEVFARKLSKAIYYKHTGKIFPNEGCLIFNWFTNSDLLKHENYPMLDALKHIIGLVPSLSRSETELNSQFQYKISISAEENVILIQAIFGGSFGFVVFGSIIPELIETKLSEIQQERGSPGPFKIIHPV